MDFSPIQIILVALVTFIAGIDQFSLTETVYRPIVLGTVVGAILGNVETGLVVGGSYELMMVGAMPVGGSQPPNSVIGAIMATALAISMDMADPAAALGLSIPFALLGQYCVILMFTVSAPLMSKADKLAENADVKGIVALNWTTMCLIGLFFAVVAVIGLVAGTTMAEAMSKAFPAWVWTGLGAAGNMMRFVGFAVLMKVMLSTELWGFYFAGFAAASIIDKTGLNGQCLLLIAMIGGCMAIADFQSNVKMKGLGQGGSSDGI